MAEIAYGSGNEPGLPQVNLPSFNASQDLPPEDTSLHITVRPRREQQIDPAAEAEVQADVQREIEERGLQQDAAPHAAGAEPNVSQVTSEPSQLSSQIQTALHNGYSKDELKGFLESKGMSSDDADMAIVDSVKNKVIQAKQAGYKDDDILNYMVDSGYDGQLTDNAIKAAKLDDRYKALDYKPNELSEQDKAMDIADLYKNVYQKYSTMGKQVLGVFNDEAGVEARREINQLNYAVAEKLKKEGIDAFIDNNTGDVMMRDKQGMVTEVDSSFLNSIWNSKGEFAGAVAGGIAGARGGAMAGGAIGSAVPVVGTAAGAAVGTIVGAVGGSMLGAAGGRGIDMAINSMKLSEDLSAQLYMTQMKQAGIFDGVVGVLGGAAIKLTAKGARSVMKGYRYLSHGNPEGAFRALKENLNITDDQAKEMINNWEKLNGQAAPGDTFAEKAISVVSQTGQGAETAVKQAAGQNERVATIIKQSVNERAKGLQRAVDSVTDNNVGSFVRNDLKAYQDDVKQFYDVIKKQGADEINGTDFRFDLDKLAIKPVMDNIEKKLSNPIARERFVSYAARIESASADRTFSGLLELRAAVNDFKYSKSLSTPDVEAINTVINKIDGQIGKAVKEYMPDTGKQWMENFSLAKSEYSKMKKLQENTLFRLVNRPGMTEDGIQKALSRYGSDKDVDAEVFDQLVTRLSPATRAKVEGAAIRNIVNKNTAGEFADFQAIHFTQLAEDLKGLNITTKEAKNLVQVVDEIAKVFKNDQELSGIMGRTTAKQMQSALSNNPAKMAEYAIVRSLFNSVYKYAPTQGARNLALIHQVDRLFKNPLHAKTADDLLKAMPKEAQGEMSSLIKDLQVQAAKQGPKKPQDFVNMYKQSKSGKLVVTDGALGKGVYLVDKIKNPTPEMNVIKHEVNMSRMATLDDISTLVGKQVTAKDLRTIPNLQQQLIDKGYLGVRVEDKAMLFPESTLGVKTPKTKDKLGAKIDSAVEQAQRKAALDKSLANRQGLTSGTGQATQEMNRLNQIVKQLNDKSWGTTETRQALIQEAKDMGYNLYKREKSGSAKNGNGTNTVWAWSRNKEGK